MCGSDLSRRRVDTQVHAFDISFRFPGCCCTRLLFFQHFLDAELRPLFFKHLSQVPDAPVFAKTVPHTDSRHAGHCCSLQAIVPRGTRQIEHIRSILVVANPFCLSGSMYHAINLLWVKGIHDGDDANSRARAERCSSRKMQVARTGKLALHGVGEAGQGRIHARTNPCDEADFAPGVPFVPLDAQGALGVEAEAACQGEVPPNSQVHVERGVAGNDERAPGDGAPVELPWAVEEAEGRAGGFRRVESGVHARRRCHAQDDVGDDRARWIIGRVARGVIKKVDVVRAWREESRQKMSDASVRRRAAMREQCTEGFLLHGLVRGVAGAGSGGAFCGDPQKISAKTSSTLGHGNDRFDCT